MTDHPLQPTPEQFGEWLAEACRLHPTGRPGDIAGHVAGLAYAAGADAGAKGEYQRGADAELKTVLLWLQSDPYTCHLCCRLRAARRPKPPSLKQQALEQLGCIQTDLNKFGMGISTDTIRRAIEALPEEQA